MPVQAMPPSDDERLRQARVLSGLRARAMERADSPKDWQLTPAASRIGVSASQLARYESGETILPTTYYRAVASVYGITRTDLARALGILDDDDHAVPHVAPWSLDAELRAAGAPEWAVQRVLHAAHGEPLMIQQWIAEKVREMLAGGELPDHEPVAETVSPLAFLRHA